MDAKLTKQWNTCSAQYVEKFGPWETRLKTLCVTACVFKPSLQTLQSYSEESWLSESIGKSLELHDFQK